ncbi:MAG TPA: universal stress protein [Candidatus Nocardiopsis merdipullorum]|nr:universal stress protein [Candidatus Nocardiopsis merdipullorum]
MVDDTAASPKVLVGIDDSSTAQEVLTRAATEANRRKVPLAVVYALSAPLGRTGSSGTTRSPPSDTAVEHAEHILADTAEHVRAESSAAQVETLLALENPAVALMRRSGPEDLIVVGSRGLGALGTAFRRSVSVRLASQVTCPVVVVHSTREKSLGAEPRRIVVGVDGSEHSQRALVFALEQGARSSGASLVVVNSTEPPTPFAAQSLIALRGQYLDKFPEHVSKDLVMDMVAHAKETTADNVDITVLSEEGAPLPCGSGAPLRSSIRVGRAFEPSLYPGRERGTGGGHHAESGPVDDLAGHDLISQ